MDSTSDIIKRIQAAYLQEFGTEISAAEAEDIRLRLRRLFSIIYRPLPVNTRNSPSS